MLTGVLWSAGISVANAKSEEKYLYYDDAYYP